MTAQGGLKNKNIYESPTFSDLSNMQLKNNENENFDELLNIKFPINNKTFNYMIIDANLAIKENLQNIFLIEFDLLNNNKENNNNYNKFIKLLREINHPDRELFFVLNGTIHGVNMFTSELKFSVEQRKFIKSIQFKLDTYKKDLINQKMQHPDSPDKLKIRNTFFAKILSNVNIGIEFSKPHFNMRNPEKFQTNFNSIVNSKININKIFLEVSIPKSFLSSNDYYLTRIDDKIEENENQIKEILLDKFNDNSNEKTTSTTFASNNNNSNANINSNSNINNNNNGYNSPTWSTIENMINNNNNIYSKSSLRNKQINIPSLNQNFNFNFLNIKDHLYNSPHLGYSYPKFLQQQNMMTPDNFSLLFGGGRSINNNNTVNNINNSTFSSSLHFSPNFGINNFNSYIPASPGGRSYIGNNNQIMFNNFNNNNANNKIYPSIPPFELDPNNSMLSRYSENSLFSESNTNNNVNSPRSVINYSSNYHNTGLSNNNFNIMNNQSQLSVRSFGRASFYKGMNNNNIFSNLNNMSFNLNINANAGSKSPRNVSNLNFTNFNISEEKKVFNGIPTIKKKIMDWEKSNSKGEKDIQNELNNDMNYSKSNSKESKNDEKMHKIEYFIDYYEGACNYLIFLKNSTPYINIKHLNNYRDLTLDNFFKSFQKISLSGLKVDFLSNNMNEKNNLIDKNILNIGYSLSLSSLEITFTNKDIIMNIIDYLISIKKCTEQIKCKIEENYNYSKEQIINMNNINNIINKNNNYIEFYPIDKNNSLKIILRGFSKISIEYNENKPPHLRKSFYQQIKDITNILSLNNILISNIVGKSYFSIRYTPINCRNKNNIQTSFINYYKFKINEERITYSNKYIDIPVIGILPLKLNHKFFLEKIIKDYMNNNNISDIMTVNRLIQNVTNNLLQNGNGNSFDVEYYLSQQI